MVTGRRQVGTRRRPYARGSVTNGSGWRATRDHIASAVPACAHLIGKLRRAEGSRPGDDQRTLAVSGAHHTALEMGRAHSNGGELDKTIGNAWVAVKNDAPALGGRVAEQLEVTSLGEQAARRRPSSEYILTRFT